MAVSDRQIVDWFLANEGADDATIAATMDQFGLTPADIARATGTDVADVTSRYEAVAPVVEAPVGGLSAVTSGKSTVLEDTSSVDIPETTGALTQATTPVTNTGALNQATTTTPTAPVTQESTKTPVTISGGQVTETNALVDLGDGTFRTPGGVIIDANG